MSSFASSTLLNAVRTSTVISVPPPTGTVTIGTHDGSFHCDEALAVSMLKLLPKYASATVVRTRNPEILGKCSIVVDVGAVYDADTERFDHHQREFTGTLDNYHTKLSSAGLVYKHYGKSIIKEILGCEDSHELVEICYDKVYKNFIEHIDAIDNGVAIADTPPKYHVSTSLSSRVGRLNPAWNEPQTPDIVNNQFIEAMTLTCSEFVGCIKGISDNWWPARSIVASAIEKAKSVHESGEIIVLEQFCPWKEHLFELEEASGVAGRIKYALYGDSGGSWRIQAVPVDPNSFSSRKKLPEPWCGVRDEALSEKSGVSGCIFIHASGFIGGCKTKEGALALAKIAVEKF